MKITNAMTVSRLIELLSNLDPDALVYLDDPTSPDATLIKSVGTDTDGDVNLYGYGITADIVDEDEDEND